MLAQPPGRSTHSRRRLAAGLAPLGAVLLATACTGPLTPRVPAAGVAPQLGESEAPGLRAALLQPGDLPDQPDRRVFVGSAPTADPIPQLALCQPNAPLPSHSVANVVAGSPKPGAVKVFEVVARYADEAGASQAYDRYAANARSCPSFAVGATTYRVEDLQPVAAPPPAVALHYRLTTPAVVTGDVRTIARRGPYVVMVSGYGIPESGVALLDYQAALLTKAVARLPA